MPMGKNKKIQKPPSKIKQKTLSVKSSQPKETLPAIDTTTPILRFKYLDPGRYTIHDLTREQLESFLRFTDRIHESTWAEVYTDKGIRYQQIDRGYLRKSLRKISNIPTDVNVFELRVDGSFRVFAFRDTRYCFLIWFDPKHEIFPM